MHLANIVAAGLAPAMATALSPSLSHFVVECVYSTLPDPGATCSSLASSWGLTVDALQQLNPDISCPGLDLSRSYCVIGTVTEDTYEPSTTLTTTTSTSTSIRTTTTSTTAATTTIASPSNSPTMPGIAENCDGFYQISAGDQCLTIAAKHSITMDQLKSWNSAVNDDCTNLWLDYYICVHVPGASTTEPTGPGTTDESEVPTGPTPQMPGIVYNCKSYHLIESGESCWSIYTGAGITFEQFRLWNTHVDAACSNLWLGYYVCVGI